MRSKTYTRILWQEACFCGEKPGLAQVLKLANNILFATSIFATTEAIAMGVKAGLDPSLILDAIRLAQEEMRQSTLSCQIVF